MLVLVFVSSLFQVYLPIIYQIKYIKQEKKKKERKKPKNQAKKEINKIQGLRRGLLE